MTKPWWSSKTVWLAILQAIAGVLTAFFAQDPNLKTVGGVVIVKSALDLIIRSLTEVPLE